MQAYAAAKFADACLQGLRGDAGIVECSFVASQVSVTCSFVLYSTLQLILRSEFCFIVLLFYFFIHVGYRITFFCGKGTIRS